MSKVLVVDDDPVIAKSFDRVLTGQGYAVVTACDGEEALRKIAAEEYDAVFTDIRMPGVDGITVAERIKAQRPWTPVVIVSGYATPENEARAKAAGVCAVLHKPLTPEMIEQSARDALHSGAGSDPRGASASGLSVEAGQVATTREAAATVAPALSVPSTPAASQPAPQATQAPVEQETRPVLRMIAAPFITLAYITVGPFVGLAVMVLTPLWLLAKWLVARPTTQFTRWARDIALFLAAPFLSLAYVILFPFVGIGVIAGVGFKSLFGRRGEAAEVQVEMKLAPPEEEVDPALRGELIPALATSDEIEATRLQK